jgi:hypothetical protein
MLHFLVYIICIIYFYIINEVTPRNDAPVRKSRDVENTSTRDLEADADICMEKTDDCLFSDVAFPGIHYLYYLFFLVPRLGNIDIHIVLVGMDLQFVLAYFDNHRFFQ